MEGRAGSLIGQTDLRTVTGVMANCAAFVSNDSGAMHLAAAAGVHVTALPGRLKMTAPGQVWPARFRVM